MEIEKTMIVRLITMRLKAVCIIFVLLVISLTAMAEDSPKKVSIAAKNDLSTLIFKAPPGNGFGSSVCGDNVSKAFEEGYGIGARNDHFGKRNILVIDDGASSFPATDKETGLTVIVLMDAKSSSELLDQVKGYNAAMRRAFEQRKKRGERSAASEGFAATEPIPLDFWVIRSKPFEGAEKVSVEDLKLDGYCRRLPDVRVSAIRSVHVTTVKSRSRLLDSDGNVTEEKEKNIFIVRVQLGRDGEEQLMQLLKTNAQARLLLRLGAAPLHAPFIMVEKHQDGVARVALSDTEGGAIQVGRALDDGVIEIPQSNQEATEALRVKLLRLVTSASIAAP